MEQKLQAMCGDTVLKPMEEYNTPFDFWSHYADAIDIDTAKLAFSHAVKFYYRAQVHKNRYLNHLVMDVVEVRDRLQLK